MALMRFVVLHHQVPEEGDVAELVARGSHYDLMLESNQILQTWALTKWPLAIGESTAARELPPHRLAYLDYEGPISGNRGTVTRVCCGTYCWCSKNSDGREVNLMAVGNRTVDSDQPIHETLLRFDPVKEQVTRIE